MDFFAHSAFKKLMLITVRERKGKLIEKAKNGEVKKRKKENEVEGRKIR